MLKKITVMAPAKLNLMLDIDGKRCDGYHLMKMIMQSIDLADIITISLVNNNGIKLNSNCEDIPLDDTNIVCKAAKMFFEYTKIHECGLEIYIDKKIPFKAGMGGGSADGAGVLIGLNELLNTNLKLRELVEIGVAIGADIPFCLFGGTAMVSGVGENVIPLKSIPDCNIVVAKPSSGVDTRNAFEQYDKACNVSHKGTTAPILLSLAKNDLKTVSAEMYNVFEQIIKIDDVPILKSIMLENGALGSIMTGSGSAVFGIFNNHEKASNCVKIICEMGIECHLCSPVNHGAKII